MASSKYPSTGRGGKGSKSPIPVVPPKKGYGVPERPATGRSGRTTPTPPTMGRSGKVSSGMTPTTGRRGSTAKVPTISRATANAETRIGAAGPKSYPKGGRGGRTTASPRVSSGVLKAEARNAGPKTGPKTGRRGVAGAVPPSKGRGGKVGTGVTPTGGRKGVGPVASVSSRVRGAEWKYRDAQHKANNRAKAAKSPSGRIAKAIAKRSQARYNKSGKLPK